MGLRALGNRSVGTFQRKSVPLQIVFGPKTRVTQGPTTNQSELLEQIHFSLEVQIGYDGTGVPPSPTVLDLTDTHTGTCQYITGSSGFLPSKLVQLLYS